MDFINYVIKNYNQIISLFIEHIELTCLSLICAIVIGVPVGILISYYKKLNKPVVGVANLVQAIPSMALLGFAIPFLGIGTVPAVAVVVLYSLLPIIKNTFTGISNISDSTIESARGIGLTNFQILTKVQIPQALPVIMAGVRISAVSAVGLMTISAFIGGGGLGFLIYSGIRTINNNQILCGAIPACILALIVDYFFSLIEKIVTPISLQKNIKDRSKYIKEQRKSKVILVIIILLILGIFISQIDFSKKSSDTIIVASKDFTEQDILCYMSEDIIEAKTNINVETKCSLGGAPVVFSALKNSNIDFYIDYAGTDYTEILDYKPITDIDKVYNTIKKEFSEKYNIEALPQMAFNNTYALAVTKDTASKYNLKTISDLALVSNNLTISPTLEFVNREDGLSGLKKTYGLNFKDTIAMDGSPRYTALINNNAEVIDAFTTDGLLKKFDLVVLKDDKNFFPPYYAIPLVRKEILKRYPSLKPIMTELGTYLTDGVMQQLNYEVDELGENPSVVAENYLKSVHLIN